MQVRTSLLRSSKQFRGGTAFAENTTQRLLNLNPQKHVKDTCIQDYHSQPAAFHSWSTYSRFQPRRQSSTQANPIPATSQTMASIQLDPTLFNPTLYTELLNFWLPTYPTPTSDNHPSDAQKWFTRDPTVDAECARIAGPALRTLDPSSMPLPPFISLETDHANFQSLSAPFHSLFPSASSSPSHPNFPREHTALALLILLDQMPRNLFRGPAQGIVYTHYDRLARALAAWVRAENLDSAECFRISPVWKLWVCLPLEHSEALDDHALYAQAIAEMRETALGRKDEVAGKMVEQMQAVEERHVGPLKRFGRYPWRNEWVGRESTQEEKKWLAEGGDRFGTG